MLCKKPHSGHPGLPMGMADVATVLFTKFMKFDAANPDWFDRDRFHFVSWTWLHAALFGASILHGLSWR